MKLPIKLYEKNNLLDEMQEKKLLKIESRGYWLLWGALLASLMVQSAMDAPAAQFMPETLTFIAICLYSLVCSVRAGIWDRHIVPTVAGNVVGSLVGGTIIMLYLAVKMRFRYGTPLWVCLAGGAFGFVFTAGLIFALLQASLAAYNKRKKQLESEDEPE